MNTRKSLIAAVIAAAMASVALPASAQTTAAMKQKSDVLQRIDMLGTHYQLGLQKAVWLPDEVKPRHMHTGPEVAYVLDGEVILMNDGQPVETFRKGESFQIQAAVPHITKAGPKGATVLATWIAEKGKPLAVPAP